MQCDRKNILCFGDSLTWGWVPVPQGMPTTRYAFKDRWTGAMSSHLGAGYYVIEEGLSGRTTDVDDPNDPRLNASLQLPSILASHLPLDLVIIMLGTNDTKILFDRTPFDITYGLAKLVGQVGACAGGVGTAYPAPKTLIVAPPPLAPMTPAFVDSLFEGAIEKSSQFAKHYEDLAICFGLEFLNAAEFIQTDGCDGVHLTASANHTLGQAIAHKVLEMIPADAFSEQNARTA